jgi:hypothetical protein
MILPDPSLHGSDSQVTCTPTTCTPTPWKLIPNTHRPHTITHAQFSSKIDLLTAKGSHLEALFAIIAANPAIRHEIVVSETTHAKLSVIIATDTDILQGTAREDS